MLKLKDLILEMGLKLSPEGDLVDDAPNADAIVSSGWNANKEHLRTKNGMTIFPAYTLQKVSSNRYNQFSSDQMNSIRRAVKEPSSPQSQKTVDLYIRRSLYPFKQFVNYEKINTIIPLDSSSGINDKIAKTIQTIIPNAEILSDALKKVTWKDVEIDYEGLKGEKEGNESLKYLESYLKGKKENHPDEIMKVSGIKMSLRRYLKNFMRINPDFKQDVLKRNIHDKTVLIIDDTMEEGATMESAYQSISSLSPREILIYVFLFTESGAASKHKSPPDFYKDHVKGQFEV